MYLVCIKIVYDYLLQVPGTPQVPVETMVITDATVNHIHISTSLFGVFVKATSFTFIGHGEKNVMLPR